MVQQVYVAHTLTDEELVGLFFGLPFFGAWFYLCSQLLEWNSVHPVLRILLALAACALVILGALRLMRVFYSLAVAVTGTALIFVNAPDLLWKAFLEVLLLLIWGAITYNFEKQQSRNIPAPKESAPAAQNTVSN